MKVLGTILKIVAALAALAGIIYVVATYGDKIVAWAKKLLNCGGECCCEAECCCADDQCCCEETCEEAPAEEAPVEEAPVAEETVQAEESDFEG